MPLSPIKITVSRLLALSTIAALAISPSAIGSQEKRPAPQKPVIQANFAELDNDVNEGDARQVLKVTQPDIKGTSPIRTGPVPGGKIILAFDEAPVNDTIQLIAMVTGKIVMPVNLSALKTKKITLFHDEPVDGEKALDLVMTALRLNGVGIIETDEVVIMDLIENVLTKQPPVLSHDVDVMRRSDLGNYVVKIYRLKEASAETVAERLQDNLPDYATLGVDVNSNQIIMHGDVGLAQHLQRMIEELDRTHVVVKTQTFRLAYADASEIAEQILELFEESNTTAGRQAPSARSPRNTRGRARGQTSSSASGVTSTAAGVSTPGPSVELKVSVNIKQNSVTVSGEPEKIEAISELIAGEWDLPREPETAKVYILEHTDPLKVRDLLHNLLGGGGGVSRSSRGQRGIAAGASSGQSSAISEVIGDIYRIEAYPDANSLVVLSKTKEALDYLDTIIAEVDQPSSVGVPLIVPLKHASAVNLAEELNVLLAEAGAGGGLERPGTGLTGEGMGGVADGGGGLGTTSGTQQGGGQAAGRIEFPWQRGRARDDQTPESSLIGKVRIVPVVRQNALAILAPVAQREAVADLIGDFDRPGRQVMISAIIAEVELTDELALGLRVSSDDLVSSVSDNSFRGGFSFEGSEGGFLGNLFDTAVLDVNVSINTLIQALKQKTNVRILQEPRVFTADNQEAIFFDGQDVPFITQSQTISTGGITQSFDYVAVGVQLDVRPRITVQRDVDMEVRLELSSVVPGETLFGGFILDRRTTTTQVIVKNGQTIVLSGILTDSESEITRGLPLISEIPLIGELFKSRETSKVTTELIAFITPIVVDNPSENDYNFNRLERGRLEELSRPLKEQAKDKGAIRDRILDPKLRKPTMDGDVDDESPAENDNAANESTPFDPV